MNWVLINYGLIVIVLTQFALLVRDHVKLQDLLAWQPRVDQRVDQHIGDDSRHMDNRSWEELRRRLDTMERKIDRILVNESQIIKYQKGDPNDV